MTEFKIGRATVRIHGDCDPENLKAATVRFLKAAEQQRKKVRNEAIKKTDPATENPHAAAETSTR